MKAAPVLPRRDFLKRTALAAVATAALPATMTSAAPAGEPKLPWKFCGFEKPLQFLNYDDTAALFAELGFDGIEATVRPSGHVLPERVEDDLPKMVAALKKHGLEMTILTSGISRVDQPHTEKVLRTAAKLGIQRYRMDWYRYDLKRPILKQLDEMRPQLKDLAALNRSLGMTALYQNHAGPQYVGAPLWDIYNLFREHDPKDVALAYDIRHATVESGLSWEIQFHLVKDHIGAAFFKDFVWEKRTVNNVPLGTGLIDPKYVALLKASGFKGPISLHVEYGSGQDKQVFAESFRKDFAQLRAWLAA